MSLAASEIHTNTSASAAAWHVINTISPHSQMEKNWPDCAKKVKQESEIKELTKIYAVNSRCVSICKKVATRVVIAKLFNFLLLIRSTLYIHSYNSAAGKALDVYVCAFAGCRLHIIASARGVDSDPNVCHSIYRLSG
jgi:hypothetical protein